ncbi:MAG: DUF1631 domain-containing protein [Thiobacillus sp.]|nr:DUF1631 domain-containing protein [Thiobacillus sp.]
MDAARNNVMQMSDFAHARVKAVDTPRSPLDECREMATLRLGGVLHDGLILAAGQFRRMFEQSTGSEICHLYMEAMELARDRAEAIGEAFRGYYLSGFNGKARRSAAAPALGFMAGELSLLDPDDLEVSLAADNMANAIFNACSEELYGLGKRIGLLINQPDLSHDDSPLGPKTIGKAVMDALHAEGASLKVRLLIATQLGHFLPERVRDIYREINARLAERNVLPTIPVGQKRPSTQEHTMQVQTAAQTMSEDNLFGVLQRLLSGNLAPTPLQAPAIPGEAAEQAPARSGLMQALDQLQHGRVESAGLAGIDPAKLAGGQANVLRDLRGGDMAGMMNPLDSMTLDIVAMVFDYIFGDARIPDAIKALLGRLQIPMLKVAMQDKSFFSHKNHPARRFLDGLAEAAIGWDPAEGHEGGLYREVEQLVDGILEHFEDNLEIFEASLADLRAWLDAEKRQADRQAARSAMAVKSRELAEHSRLVAHDEVEASLLGRPVPPLIRSFLNDHWIVLLAELHLKVGGENEVWKGAVQTMKDLIWSVKPKADAVARKRLVSLLPGLLKRLDEGVKYLGLPEKERNTFFAGLVKYHAELVRAGKLAESVAIAEPVAGSAEAIPVIDMKADFEPVEPAAEVAEAVVEAVLDTGIEPETGPLAFKELAGLRRGSWIAYRQDNGEEVRAKLSWISPLRGVFLFTNRHGQRAMSINAEGLAAKLNAGQARLLDAPPLIERAVDSMMEQLQRHAA